MKYIIHRIAIAAIASSLIASASAAGAAKPTPLSSTDRGFLADALATNQLEIDASAYVATQSGSAKVRQFAQDMANEHRKLAAEFQKANDGIVVPPAPSPQPGINLQGRSGAEFDKAYAAMMASYEKGTVSKFTIASDGPLHGQVIRDMTKNALPTLRRLAETSKVMEQSLPAR